MLSYTKFTISVSSTNILSFKNLWILENDLFILATRIQSSLSVPDDDWILVVRVGSSLPDCYGNLVSAGKYCQYNAVTLYYVMILQ